tara:strand:- start:1345 stop:1887 length:543 start_codon:yes stop_codon:yes gene_type:complete
MKFTGRTLYISGTVTTQDITSGGQPTNTGLISIWENERNNYGYLVRYISAFPNPGRSVVNAQPFILTTYSQRDLFAMRDGGVPGGNMVLQILGITAGVSPAGNDRVLASYHPQIHQDAAGGVVKRDALVCQSLSLGVDQPDDAVSYYVELDEYILDDNEYALAMLGESGQNVGNFEVRKS